MNKTLTLFLNTSPYNYENSYTAMKIAEAALDRDIETHLVASADGVYNFLKGQKGSGLPHAADRFKELMDKGLKVDL
ncbi:MAG: DsrE family protein [Nitrospiraceae bacterium]|nr:MAG: DsrE family protein [Nitrospiraceae bacterium]